MALNEAERTDVRRHCGHAARAGATFPAEAGLLEWRMARLSSAEEAVVRRYLAQLAELEAAVPAASAMLDTDAAAVWKRNPRELRDRRLLFDDWRRRLCGFLGVRPGPALGEGGLRLVV